MLTGKRAFPGEDLTDTLAAVVRAEPNWTLLPPGLSPTLVTYLKRCLQKDPKQRAQAIGDVRLALDGAFETAATAATSTTIASSHGRRPLLAALAGMAALVAGLAVPALRYVRQTSPPAPPEMRLEITTPATDAPLQFALSPDGRSLVFVASGDGPSRLWLRPLDQTEARPLPGTERAIRVGVEAYGHGGFAVSGAGPVAYRTGGDTSRRWRADGQEFYFLAPNAMMMAAPVTAAGASFAAGTPVALFPSRIRGEGSVATDRVPYAVARDGRFLINQPVGDATAAPITLILNWQRGLSARDK